MNRSRQREPQGHSDRRRRGVVVACLLAGLAAFGATNSMPPVPVPTNAGPTNVDGLEEIPQLRPPHGEIPPTFWEQHRSQVGGGILVLVVLGGASVWWLARTKPPILVPAEVEARRELEALRSKPEDSAVLSQVSQALRHYVARAFGLPPEELTTSEFCRLLAGQEAVGPELTAAVAEFLRRSDERKFSPSGAGPPQGAAAQALSLVDQAEARRAQLKQTPAGKAAAA